jgi:hypothetical protein
MLQNRLHPEPLYKLETYRLWAHRMLFLQDFVLQVHRLDQALADAQEQSRMLEIDRHSQLRLEEMVV